MTKNVFIKVIAVSIIIIIATREANTRQIVCFISADKETTARIPNIKDIDSPAKSTISPKGGTVQSNNMIKYRYTIANDSINSSE